MGALLYSFHSWGLDMTCNNCGSEQLQLIKVFAGHNAMAWSPVGGEKDIFGNYKKRHPLLAHGCNDCGNVNWNIKIEQPRDPNKAAQALDDLASDDLANAEAADPGEDSVAYSLEDELA